MLGLVVAVTCTRDNGTKPFLNKRTQDISSVREGACGQTTPSQVPLLMNLCRSAALPRMTIRVHPPGPGTNGACGEVPEVDGNGMSNLYQIKRQEKSARCPDGPRDPVGMEGRERFSIK